MKQDIIKRSQELEKMTKSKLVELVRTYYRVVDTKNVSKGVLVDLILIAEFGEKEFDKAL